jgi:hypothetical protein
LLGELHGPLYGSRVARDYHLTGGIEIDRAYNIPLGGTLANGDDLVVFKTEDGGHRRIESGLGAGLRFALVADALEETVDRQLGAVARGLGRNSSRSSPL